jgi:phospho-N-acetylmuramoyl-pentapeptide-transferase
MIYYLSYLEKYHPIFNVFHYLTVRIGIASLFSLFFTFWLTPRLSKKLERMGFLAQIRKKWFHNLHDYKSSIPTGGGLGVMLSIFLTTILFARLNVWIFILLFLIFSFTLLGFFDDWLKFKRKNADGIRKSHKLYIEIVLGLLVGLWLFFQKTTFPITSLSFPFFKNLILDLGPFFILWVMLVILATSNAVNLTDGLDGLAASCLVFVGIGYTILSYLSGHAVFSSYLYIPFIDGAGELAVVCAALTFSCLGFLWYNAYPSEIFLGDVGALPLGALLGFVALVIKQELILPIIAGIFVIESLSVIIQVIYFKKTKGKRIFKMTPIHHHFELKNWPEPKIVTRFQIISIILLIIGLLTLKLR